MSARVISIANEFSPYPVGRYVTDGPNSGERFREEFLAPALKAGQSLVIDMDGVLGYGSSFLEEAFGGLVRVHKLGLALLKDQLKVKCSVPVYERRVWQYIEEENARR